MTAPLRLDVVVILLASAAHLTEAISGAAFDQYLLGAPRGPPGRFLVKRAAAALNGSSVTKTSAAQSGADIASFGYDEGLLQESGTSPGDLLLGRALRDLLVNWKAEPVEPPSSEYAVLPVAPQQRTVLLGILAMAVVLDFMVLHRFTSSATSHFVALCFWLLMATAYAEVVSQLAGPTYGVMWAESYVLDWVLSFDNIFAFHVIFVTFKTKPSLQQKVMSVWLIIAIVLRSIFYQALQEALTVSPVMRYACGAFLVYTAYLVMADDDDLEVDDLVILRFLKWLFGGRLDSRYDDQEGKFFFWGGDRIQASLLVFVLLLVCLIDLVYAIDSIGAKVAAIPNTFVGWSSSMLFLFAMRPAFFLLEDAVEAFVLLKYGIATILVFLGFEFLLSDFVKVEPQQSAQIIASIFFVCVAGSIIARFTPSVSSKPAGKASTAERHVVQMA